MRLTKQYAHALFAAMQDARSVEFYHELIRVEKILKNLPEYVTAVDFQPEKFSLIRETLEEGFDPLLVNFLEVLAQDGMLSRLDTVIEDFRILLVEENLLHDVKVYSAVPLNETSKKHIERLVENRWGTDYLMEYKVNKQIIGGIRLEVNGAVIDTTFRSRIDQIIREVQNG